MYPKEKFVSMLAACDIYSSAKYIKIEKDRYVYVRYECHLRVPEIFLCMIHHISKLYIFHQYLQLHLLLQRIKAIFKL